MDFLSSVELIANYFDKWLIGVIHFQKRNTGQNPLIPASWMWICSGFFPPQRWENEYLWVVVKTRHFEYVVFLSGKHWSTCLTILWHFVDQTTNHGIEKWIDDENNYSLQTMSSCLKKSQDVRKTGKLKQISPFRKLEPENVCRLFQINDSNTN